MIARIVALLLISLICFSSCKSKKGASGYKKIPNSERAKIGGTKTTPPSKVEGSPTEVVVPKTNATYAEIVAAYISNYSDIAQDEMLQYGVPASITLAQGILESGAGRGELTQKANNHFGIKCHTSWTGERVYHDDDELQECFRKYKDPKYSYRDHSLFLTGRSRYGDLFKLKIDDYRGWAKGLRKAGYATDPKYPDKLISIIQRYDLDKFDDEILKNSKKEPRTEVVVTTTHTVEKGDTLYSISRRYQLSVNELKRLNDLNTNDISIGQELLIPTTQN